MVSLSKRILILSAIIIFIPISLPAAEQAGTQDLVRKLTPPLAIMEKKETLKDTWYLDAFYEPSDILQGNKTGHWNEVTTAFGHTHKNIQGYFSVSQLERFDIKDFTANLGSYLSFKDSYVHIEAGFGWNVDYIYDFQSIAEYGHKLIKDLYWQIGYTYRNYELWDTHLVYPMLIYYFGDSYMSAMYGASFMESHDTAQIATFKGDFAITEFLRWSAGVAFGERLYDIYSLPARQETGFILFTGLNLKFYKGINFRLGYSYGEEAPKFIKRSVNFALSVKF